MRDVKVWVPKMKSGAIVMFNDYSEDVRGIFPGVNLAANEFANNTFVKLRCCVGGNNAWLRLP
jgi:hypothetical protein